MGLGIEFLTDDSVTIDLCSKYWELNEDGKFRYRVSDLLLPSGVTRYGLAAYLREHCRAFEPGNLCPDCGRPFILGSRTDYQPNKRWVSKYPCDECRRLQAEREQAAREAAAQAKRLQIQTRFGDVEHGPVVRCDSLSLKEATGLLALLRLAASEDLSVIFPVEKANGLLASTTSLTFQVLCMLKDNGRILVHPSSPTSAFTDDLGRMFPSQVAWWPPVAEDGRTQTLVSSLEHILQGGDWPDRRREEVIPFWREVALDECLQYLDACMKEHSFEFSPGDKTRQVLDSVLRHYSPAQIYSFIFRAVKDAVAYHVRNRVPKKQAANSVIGNIQRSAERALAEGWAVKHYGRDWTLPESMVAHILYRLVLDLEGEGINYVPGDW